LSNTFGQIFKITTWGESHGTAVGVTIDGCPPGIEITENEIQFELNRRRPGQSEITTQRKESDIAAILSGTFEGKSLGSPIHISVTNQDAKSKDYEPLKNIYRPSHADYTYDAKYGIRNWKGGGRASARETIGRVAAGAIAKKILKMKYDIEIIGYVKSVKDIIAKVNTDTVTLNDVEKNIVRCPDNEAAATMINKIKEVRKQGDSLGGTVELVCRNVPTGLGAPVFDKLEADLAKALLSLPACKGFEVGSGFNGTKLMGSEHNDEFYIKDGVVSTKTNNSGGIQGGITNGENIILRAAFKPTGTIIKSQQTVTDDGKEIEFKGRGRHDPCVLPRAVPMVESMVAIVLLDHALRQESQNNFI
jgi:chorismate synthase